MEKYTVFGYLVFNAAEIKDTNVFTSIEMRKMYYNKAKVQHQIVEGGYYAKS